MKTENLTQDTLVIEHHHVLVNGIHMHYVEAGKGPLVILLHGFPELWYSWRSQIPAISNAGYRVVAPDLRGYGESDVPIDVRSYSIKNQITDITELLKSLGEENAIFIGHDWGANMVYALTMLEPAKVKAMVILSVPFYPKPIGPVSKIREFSKGKFNFVEYFQEKGKAEKEMGEDIKRFFTLFFYSLSGNAPEGLVTKLFTQKMANARLLDDIPEPEHLPSWLSDEDLDFYINSFKRTGFTGALNVYRNIDRDFAALSGSYKEQISQRALFIAGQQDAAIQFGSLEATEKCLVNLKQVILIPNSGHWIQQEKPAVVNQAILQFLSGIR